MYGATSFVGVIHVIHRVAGAQGSSARLTGGTYGTVGAAASLPISQSVDFRQSITASFDRKGYDEQRTNWNRAHVLYRAESGAFHFDLDGASLRQDPNSPHPREGPRLSPAIPVGANHNPRGAKIDENRLHAVVGYESKDWTTTLAVTHSDFDIARGFLLDVAEPDPNAAGFFQDRNITDVYFDTHLVRQFAPNVP